MSLELGFPVSDKWPRSFDVRHNFQLELESMAFCGKSFQICNNWMIAQSQQWMHMGAITNSQLRQQHFLYLN